VKALIAADGSPGSTTALQTAARLLRSADRNLDVLCVAPEMPGRNKSGRAGRARYRRRILAEAGRILEAAAASFTSGAGIVNYLTKIGSPSGVIVDKAAGYNVAVVGAKGRGTTGEFGLGPVASRVVEHSPVPVLVGRALRSEEGIRILAAVDGSAASLAAIETLDSLFDLDWGEICLMHVAETPWLHLGLEEDWQTYSEEDKDTSEEGVLEMELVREGEIAFEQARNLLHNRHLSVSTRIDQGDPANEILSEAESGQYDLVVVGATGSRDLKHDMLGSVSFKVAWNAPCSVLIVREPEQAA
jgi:nucleotide-binding universal stress UspA family protein